MVEVDLVGKYLGVNKGVIKGDNGQDIAWCKALLLVTNSNNYKSVVSIGCNKDSALFESQKFGSEIKCHCSYDKVQDQRTHQLKEVYNFIPVNNEG